MRLLPLALLSAVLAGPVAAAPAVTTTPASQLVIEDRVLATQIDGWIEIGPDGAVVGYEPTTPMKEPLSGRVKAMVSGLRFDPLDQGARPVIERARMRLSLAASELPDKSLRVVVENVTFPALEEKEGVPLADGIRLTVAKKAVIHYPEALARMGLNGRVLVAVRIAPDGGIRDLAVRQSALLHATGKDSDVQKALALLEAATLRAIARWRVNIDNPTGRPLRDDELVGLVPVEFVMHGTPNARAGQWAWETRTAPRPVPWVDRKVADRMPGIGDVAESDAFGLAAPRLKLRTDPAGSVL